MPAMPMPMPMPMMAPHPLDDVFGGMPFGPAPALPPDPDYAPLPDEEVEPLPKPMSWSDIHDLKQRALDFWQPLHKRQLEDDLCYRGRWRDGARSDAEKQVEDEIAADTTLGVNLHKAIAMIVKADRKRSMEPTAPEQVDLIADAEDAWRHTEAQIRLRHARRGQATFEQEEALMALKRGWICERVRLVPELVEEGKSAVEVTIADPLTVNPVYGPAGLEAVVQSYRSLKHELMSIWPELEKITDGDFADRGLFDPAEVTAVYDRWHVYWLVDGKEVLTAPHGLGCVPWICLPCRSNELVGSIDATQGVGSTGDDEYAYRRLFNTTRKSDAAELGLSFAHEAIGPTRDRVWYLTIGKSIWQREALPPHVIKSDDPTGIEVDLGPDGRTEIGKEDDLVVPPLQSQRDYFNVLIQGTTANIREATFPQAAFGGTDGITGALHQTYVGTSILDSVKPYIDATCMADCLRWYLVMRMYSLIGMPDQPYQFKSSAAGDGTAAGFFRGLTPDQFTVLQDAYLKVEFYNLVPGEQAQAVASAVQIKREGLLAVKALLGPGYLNRDDPDEDLRQLAIERAMQHPAMQLMEMLDAIRTDKPHLAPVMEPLIVQAIQQSLAQTMGAGAGPPGAGAPAAGQPPNAPAAQGPQGQLATPGPLPGNEPGMNAYLAGLPSVPGGTQSGISAAMLPPAAMGQTVQPGPLGQLAALAGGPPGMG